MPDLGEETTLWKPQNLPGLRAAALGPWFLHRGAGVGGPDHCLLAQLRLQTPYVPVVFTEDTGVKERGRVWSRPGGRNVREAQPGRRASGKWAGCAGGPESAFRSK